MRNYTYVGKVGKIYVKTLTNADEWYQVLTPAQAKGIRGFKIKSRFDGSSAPNSFDYAFNDSPTEGEDSSGNGFWSNTGSGSGDSAGPTNGVWARSSTAGTIIEVMVYE